MLLASAAPSLASAATLLHTTLDDAASITSPATGSAGTTTLGAADFVTGMQGFAARFNREGNDCGIPDYQTVHFPAETGGNRNIELDSGTLSLWYQPGYDSAAGDDTVHALVVVGDYYNPPNMAIRESDRLSFTITLPDWSTRWVNAPYHAALWQAGEWVQITAAWDAAQPSGSLRLYVNGVEVTGDTSSAGGWSLGTETAIGAIAVGSGTTCGDFVADGLIDELIITDQAENPATPLPTATTTPTLPAATATASATPSPSVTGDATPTSTPDSGPTNTATPTSTPEGTGITDPDAIVTPVLLPRQAVGAPFVDPPFGTTLRRVSNRSDSGGYETAIYSQLQAFSSDSAYVLLTGDAGYAVRRVEDLSIVGGLDTTLWNVPRWHPAQPHVIVHFDRNDDTDVEVLYTNVDTQVETTQFALPAIYEHIQGNPSFDALSHDGRWVGGVLTRNDSQSVIFSFDLQAGQLGAEIAIADLYPGTCAPDPDWGNLEPDWVGVAPLGNLIVVQWPRDGTSRCSGLETFDMSTGAFVGRVYEGHQHGDLLLDSDGVTQLFMTTELSSPEDPGRPALAVRELPGTSTVSPPRFLLTVDWGHSEHISCQGPDGVCLITSSGWDDSVWTPFENEIFLLNTRGEVRRLAHNRSSSCGYWVQPRATLSRDGSYAIFASDWSLGTGQDGCAEDELGRGDPYIIEVDSGSSPTPLPTATATPTVDGPPVPAPRGGGQTVLLVVLGALLVAAAHRSSGERAATRRRWGRA